MKRILFRLTATLIAFLLGGVIVYSLTKVGNETRGPITTLLDNTSAMVEKMEQKNIIEVRENRRIEHLGWMKAYQKIGFKGAIRSDHVPTMAGENNLHVGYEMKGNLFGIGYMKGLMEAAFHI